MDKKLCIFCLVTVSLVFLSIFFLPTSVFADDTPTPTPTVSITPTSTPIITATLTPTPTIINTPTPSSTNPSTSTPTPTSSSSCLDQIPGSAPQFLSAEAIGNHRIKITWIEASDPVTYYLISYGTASRQYQYGNPNIGPKGTTSFTVGNLVSGTTYYFVVRAGNGCAPGSFSNEISATTLGGKITPTPTQSILGSSADNISEGANETIIEIPTPALTVESTPTVTPLQTSVSHSKTRDIFLIFLLTFIISTVLGGIYLWMFKRKSQNQTSSNNK